jgi:hypothetical protein
VNNGGLFAVRKDELEILNEMPAGGANEALAGHESVKFELLVFDMELASPVGWPIYQILELRHNTLHNRNWHSREGHYFEILPRFGQEIECTGPDLPQLDVAEALALVTVAALPFLR